MDRIFIVGGAGFIGSNLTKALLQQHYTVTVYDNFSSGLLSHFADYQADAALNIIEGDVKNLDLLTKAMQGHTAVFHFAANPDIAKASVEPSIDFWEGTYLTQNVLEAMRLNQIKQLIYASGSGIYGDCQKLALSENHSPMLPISTYGASKLACESLLSAYCHMFNINATALRFANVVGPNQTHGVIYDFVRSLQKNKATLAILGDGQQSKSYIYVTDAIKALLLFLSKNLVGFNYYNVATEDYISVKEIADIVTAQLKLDQVNYCYQGGVRGWQGDVPVVRFDTQKIRQLGWQHQFSSHQAITKAAKDIITEVGKGISTHAHA